MQVVLMNQVTTKVLDNNRGSKLVPALGESFWVCITAETVHPDLQRQRLSKMYSCSRCWYVTGYSVVVGLQVTAGPMQPQAESFFFGKSRPETHSCTSHLGCRQKRQNTMSLVMALEASARRNDQGLDTYFRT